MTIQELINNLLKYPLETKIAIFDFLLDDIKIIKKHYGDISSEEEYDYLSLELEE